MVRPGEIMGRMAMPVWVFDIDENRIVWANASGCRMWRATSMAELRRRDFAGGMSAAVSDRLRQYQREFIAADKVFSEMWTYYPKDVPSTIRVSYSGIRLSDGRMAMLCEGGDEIDGTPDKLRSAEALMHTSVMISLYGMGGTLLYANPAASGMRPDDATDLDAHFVHAADRARLRAQLEAHGTAQLVAEVHTSAGQSWHEIVARHCMDPVTGKQACVASEVDVSGLKRTEAQARHDAWHDKLTGLPNRNYVSGTFQERLDAVLRRGRQAALLFVDLDRFKLINDSLGHGRGDDVLVEVARRLSQAVGHRGEVARLGGDEFLALVDVAGSEELEAVVGRVLGIAHRPLLIAGHRLTLSLSVGVSLAPTDGTDISALMSNSDAAMYRAKHAGGNRRHLFTSAIGRDSSARLQMEIDLRSAWEAGALRLFFQPRVSLSTGRIASAEALLRWPRAGGMVPPDVFVPLAEESGLIIPIGAWVLREAARQLVSWRRDGHELKLSVNVSARQLMDDDFLGMAQAVIRDTGCDPHHLELEITERLLLDDQPSVFQLLTDLRRMGFSISVDDFGVGYSNLAGLHCRPIDCLKIDRSFISNLDQQGPLTDLIINMGRLLDLHVVAEGVETERQLAWLQERQCDEYQGFLFSKPVAGPEFERLLANSVIPSEGESFGSLGQGRGGAVGVKRRKPVADRADEGRVGSGGTEQGFDREQRFRVGAAGDGALAQLVGQGVLDDDGGVLLVGAADATEPGGQGEGEKVDRQIPGEAVANGVEEDVERGVGVDALDGVLDGRVGEALYQFGLVGGQVDAGDLGEGGAGFAVHQGGHHAGDQRIGHGLVDRVVADEAA